ncbi:hypothetical protein Aperf_G00000080946 [Anoplocephala perfoliata]
MVKFEDFVLKRFITREEYLRGFNVCGDCYFTVHGRLIHNRHELDDYGDDVLIEIHPRLRGGKGGFGSMLRAIGNQIEKTTNNDMCRDLSGRRMRDVNAEAKLKEWYAKADERERAKLDKFLEKQRRRREALAKGPLHDHKFNDPEFTKRKEYISAELQEAVEEMLKNIVAESGPSEPAKKRRKLWIETIDGDDLSSSDDDEEFDSISQDSDSFPSTSRGTPADEIESVNVVVNVHESNDDSKNSTSACEVGPVSHEEKEKEPLPETKDDKAAEFISITDEILHQVSSAVELESYGLESLKQALTRRGLKCGGTIAERAARLFSVRDCDPSNYPVKLLARSKK